MKENLFKIGDRVKVIRNGSTYTNYKEMFQKFNFKNKDYNGLPDNGDLGTIFAIGEHPESGELLLAINLNNGHQCLMDADGVELIQMAKPTQTMTIQEAQEEIKRLQEFINTFSPVDLVQKEIERLGLKMTVYNNVNISLHKHGGIKFPAWVRINIPVPNIFVPKEDNEWDICILEWVLGFMRSCTYMCWIDHAYAKKDWGYFSLIVDTENKKDSGKS
jgi:hypothetical protein